VLPVKTNLVEAERKKKSRGMQGIPEQRREHKGKLGFKLSAGIKEKDQSRNALLGRRKKRQSRRSKIWIFEKQKSYQDKNPFHSGQDA